jgi:LysM repeat protein
MMRYLSLLLILIFISGASILVAQDGEADLQLPITEDVTYVVVAGDTLDAIGALFDVQIACLRGRNDLAPVDIISPGDELHISVECPAYDGLLPVAHPREITQLIPQVSIADGDTVSVTSTYMVQRGDTLDTIGQELNISAEAIAQANEITNSRSLQIGQTLIIPSGPEYGMVPAMDDGSAGAGGGAEGELYVIQRGDTLDVIGQERNVSVVSLMLVNDITNGRSIVPGQTILIPDNAPAYGEYPATDGGPGAGGGLSVEGEIYVVQPRDTLDTIGQEHNVSVVYLAQVNNIENPGRITPGMSLVIPDDSPVYGAYPATDGGLGAGGGANGELYVVQPRETIDGISADFNKDYRCVLEANGIGNPRRVQPGTTIVIPDSCGPYTGADIAPGAAPAGSSLPTTPPTEAPAEGDAQG